MELYLYSPLYDFMAWKGTLNISTFSPSEYFHLYVVIFHPHSQFVLKYSWAANLTYRILCEINEDGHVSRVTCLGIDGFIHRIKLESSYK